jgi:hypothetical protein
MATRKKMKDKKKPDVNPALEGLDITINPFGEIQSNYDIDKINDFLDHNVDDKKLHPRNEKDTKKPKDDGDPST